MGRVPFKNQIPSFSWNKTWSDSSSLEQSWGCPLWTSLGLACLPQSPPSQFSPMFGPVGAFEFSNLCFMHKLSCPDINSDPPWLLASCNSSLLPPTSNWGEKVMLPCPFPLPSGSAPKPTWRGWKRWTKRSKPPAPTNSRTQSSSTGPSTPGGTPPAALAGSSGPSCRWAVRLRDCEEPFGGGWCRGNELWKGSASTEGSWWPWRAIKWSSWGPRFSDHDKIWLVVMFYSAKAIFFKTWIWRL